MTIATTLPKFFMPMIPDGQITGTFTMGNGITLAATQYMAIVMQAPATGTITGAGFSTRSVTTGCTLDVRLETVGADGLPTNTLLATNSNKTQVVADADDNTWFDVVLTGSAVVTKGDLFALVWRISSGTPVALNIAGFANSSGGMQQFPYKFSASAYTDTGDISAALNYGGTYFPSDGLLPMNAGGTPGSLTYNNTSTPDVYGLKFSLPFPARVSGVWFALDNDGPSVVKFYDSDGVTVLTSVTLDEDYAPSAAQGKYRLTFPSPQSILANTAYRIGVEPSSATNLTLFSMVANSSAILAAMPGGSSFVLTSAKDPSGTGSWTDSTTSAPWMGLILDGFDSGAAAAIKTHPGMFGGIRV